MAAVRENQIVRDARLSFFAPAAEGELAEQPAAAWGELHAELWAALLFPLQPPPEQIVAIELERASPQPPYCSRRFQPSSFLLVLSLCYRSCWFAFVAASSHGCHCC